MILVRIDLPCLRVGHHMINLPPLKMNLALEIQMDRKRNLEILP
jgi:hypothetical protein